MTSEFTFPFGQLNLASLLSEKREKIMQKIGLIKTEAFKIFE